VTLARRVGVSFALVLALFGLNLVVYFWTSQQQADSLGALRSTSERRMQLRALEHDLRDRGRETVILSEAQLDAAQVRELDERLSALARRPHDMARAGSLAPEDSAMLASALERVERGARSVFTAAGHGRRADARAARGLAELAVAEALAVVDGLSRQEERRAAEATEDFFRTTALTHQVSLVTFGLSLIVTLVVGTSMAWYINRGIGQLQRGAERIAQGDLAHRIDVNRQDELGALAQSFNAMTHQLARAMTEASNARAAAERASHAKDALLASLTLSSDE
jgi:nitrogen fixation/metabolism regulation signal transduction histidine kinase